MRKNISVNDGLPLHFLTSLGTSIISSAITHPLDVVRTIMMNSRPGEFRTVFQASVHMMRFGVMGPYRGFVPTIVRKAPATTLLFVLYEQLRLHFGICSLGGEKYNWDDRAAHSEFDKNTMWTLTNVFFYDKDFHVNSKKYLSALTNGIRSPRKAEL